MRERVEGKEEGDREICGMQGDIKQREDMMEACGGEEIKIQKGFLCRKVVSTAVHV